MTQINKTEIMDKEYEKIFDLCKSFFDNGILSDNYILNEFRDKGYIELEYNFDSYGYEKITITPIILNDFGVIKYEITIEAYNSNNELETINYYYCNEIPFTEKRGLELENKAFKNINKYVSRKPFSMVAFGHKIITIENILIERECFNNITHVHEYKGKMVTLETQDFTDIRPFIQLREFFLNIDLKEKAGLK